MTSLKTSGSEGLGRMPDWHADVPARLARLAGALPELVGAAMEPLGGVGPLSQLCAAKEGADDTMKVRVRDGRGRAAAVVLWSAAANPGLIARAVALSRQAKARLGAAGAVVLEPLAAGELDGLSYVVLPYCEPMSEQRWLRKLQHWRWRGAVLAWLRAVTQATASEPSIQERARIFEEPLAHLAGEPDVPAEVRREAARAGARLRSGEWSPRHVVAHHDFWWGNLLRRRSVWADQVRANPYPFFVIDWAGARLQGHAVFDLLCMAVSIGLGPARFAAEAAWHCRQLGNAPGDAAGYVLAALGHVGLHLEHCPRELYLDRIARAWVLLSAARRHVGEGAGQSKTDL